MQQLPLEAKDITVYLSEGEGGGADIYADISDGCSSTKTGKIVDKSDNVTRPHTRVE
jgi:hypothetical protein